MELYNVKSDLSPLENPQYTAEENCVIGCYREYEPHFVFVGIHSVDCEIPGAPNKRILVWLVDGRTTNSLILRDTALAFRFIGPHSATMLPPALKRVAEMNQMNTVYTVFCEPGDFVSIPK